MMRLLNVEPDGRAFPGVDGVIRARYRHSRTRPEPLSPHAVERYEINLWATSLVVGRGHRIGVTLDSNFSQVRPSPDVYVHLSKTTERDFATSTETVDQKH